MFVGTIEELGQKKQDALLYTEQGTVPCLLETMGRSTEQRDSDNKELFEGDVCLFTSMLVENKKTFRGVIIWDKWRFTIQNLEYSPKDLYTTPLVEFDLFGVDARFMKTIHDETGGNNK